MRYRMVHILMPLRRLDIEAEGMEGMMIQQYDVRWHGDKGSSKVMGMKEVDAGPYVLTTDHLVDKETALREKEDQIYHYKIKSLDAEIKVCKAGEQIATLTEELRSPNRKSGGMIPISSSASS